MNYSTVSLLLLVLCLHVETSFTRRLRWRRFQDGKFIIGALFPITEGPDCDSVREEGLLLVEAFVHAVGTKSNESFHSPATIGYDVRDTCSSPKVALKELLDILVEKDGFSSKNCSLTQAEESCGMVAVVGPELSSTVVVTSGVLSAYGIPQVSYGASSSVLTDISIYSTFFRTGTSDRQLAYSLANVIAHFGWSCINIVSSRDSYCPGVAKSLKENLKSHNVCIAIDEEVGSYNEIPHIVLQMKGRESVAVNVVLGSEDFLVHILDEVKRGGLTKRVWIGSNAWRNDIILINKYDDVLDGSLWISAPEVDSGKFQAHVRNISRAYCKWFETNSRWPAFCERGRRSQGKSIQIRDLTLVKIDNVMNAVFAIADGVERMTQCDNCRIQQCNNQSHGSNCLVGNFTLDIARKLLLRSLENNYFINNRNINLSFNAKRELSEEFDILNLRVTGNRSLVPFRVGKWTGDHRLVMNESVIWGPGDNIEVPYSGCQQRCPLGTYTKYNFGACWWSCLKCPHGTYNSNYSETTCKACPKEQMTNELQSACVDKPLSVINSGEFLTVLLLTACSLGEMLTLFVLGVFVRYQVTPVVKAANLIFTVLSLIILLVWFLIPVLYIGEPTDTICKLRTVAFAVLYTAVTSVLLTKTNRLIKIFSAVNVKKHRFLSNCWYAFLTCALILVQLGISVFHLAVFPPKRFYDYSFSDALVVTCSKNLGLDIASFGYNTLLSIICCYLAYQSRNLPAAYNEYKWICLAMFTNFVSWLTILISRHVSPIRKTNLICTILASVLSAYSMLLLLFLPKVYVIFFRPEINTKQAAIASTRRYSLDQASGIDLSPIQGRGARRNTSPACLTQQFMNGAIGKVPVIKNGLGRRRSQGSIIATIKESP